MEQTNTKQINPQQQQKKKPNVTVIVISVVVVVVVVVVVIVVIFVGGTSPPNNISGSNSIISGGSGALLTTQTTYLGAFTVRSSPFSQGQNYLCNGPFSSFNQAIINPDKNFLNVVYLASNMSASTVLSTPASIFGLILRTTNLTMGYTLNANQMGLSLWSACTGGPPIVQASTTFGIGCIAWGSVENASSLPVDQGIIFCQTISAVVVVQNNTQLNQAIINLPTFAPEISDYTNVFVFAQNREGSFNTGVISSTRMATATSFEMRYFGSNQTTMLVSYMIVRKRPTYDETSVMTFSNILNVTTTGNTSNTVITLPVGVPFSVWFVMLIHNVTDPLINQFANGFLQTSTNTGTLCSSLMAGATTAQFGFVALPLIANAPFSVDCTTICPSG